MRAYRQTDAGKRAVRIEAKVRTQALSKLVALHRAEFRQLLSKARIELLEAERMQRLADEAERGYPPESIRPLPRRPR